VVMRGRFSKDVGSLNSREEEDSMSWRQDI